jgi:hypothetical protein
VLPFMLLNPAVPLDFVTEPNVVGVEVSVTTTWAFAVPPPPAVPDITPKTCNFLDPLRLRRILVLLLVEA